MQMVYTWDDSDSHFLYSCHRHHVGGIQQQKSNMTGSQAMGHRSPCRPMTHVTHWPVMHRPIAGSACHINCAWNYTPVETGRSANSSGIIIFRRILAHSSFALYTSNMAAWCPAQAGYYVLYENICTVSIRKSPAAGLAPNYITEQHALQLGQKSCVLLTVNYRPNDDLCAYSRWLLLSPP